MDLPWRLLSWIDAELVRVFPAPLRIVFWAALAALGSMELYRALSPQERIRSLQAELGRVQADLDAHDGSFGEGWTMVRKVLRLSVRRIVLVAPATIIASLPLLLLVVWMSGAYQGERVLEVGPSWIGGWEATFFVAVSVFALAFKSVRRIA
jgi:hypothetical protein